MARHNKLVVLHQPNTIHFSGKSEIIRKESRLTRIHLSLAKPTEIELRNKFVYRACDLMYYFMSPCCVR